MDGETWIILAIAVGAVLIAAVAIYTTWAYRAGGRLRAMFSTSPTQAWRLLRRAVVSVIGFTVLLVGVTFLVLPGPAFIVLPLGLAILATEFAWARHLLQRARRALPGANGRFTWRGRGNGREKRGGRGNAGANESPPSA